jgi:hypothetical protein
MSGIEEHRARRDAVAKEIEELVCPLHVPCIRCVTVPHPALRVNAQKADRDGLVFIVRKLTNQIEELTEEMFGEANGMAPVVPGVATVRMPCHTPPRESNRV